MTIGSRAGKQPRNSRHSSSRRTQGKFIDISICPTDLEAGDDVRDGDLVVAWVRQYAERQYPGARISVQIGYRQGHAWATVSGSDRSCAHQKGWPRSSAATCSTL